MHIYDIITPEFEDEVIEHFLKTHLDIAKQCIEELDEDATDYAEIRDACEVLLKYAGVPE